MMGESGLRRATGTRDYSRSTYFSLTFLSTRRHEASYAPNRPAPLSNDPLSNKAVRRPKWSRVAWTETMQAGLLNPKVTEHKACLLFHGYSENERTQLDDRAESKMPLLGRETVEDALMRTSSSVSPLVASASTSSAVEEQLVKYGAYQALLVGGVSSIARGYSPGRGWCIRHDSSKRFLVETTHSVTSGTDGRFGCAGVCFCLRHNQYPQNEADDSFEWTWLNTKNHLSEPKVKTQRQVHSRVCEGRFGRAYREPWE